MIPLIAVAHGSRDPRSAATVAAVVERMRDARPELDVRLAFLDLNAPSVEQVLDAVAAEGHHSAVVVPLLLGSAFHARVDLPGMLAAARRRHPNLVLTQAEVLGIDPLLVSALHQRIQETGVSGHVGIAVTAVGASSARANSLTRTVARSIAAETGWLTGTCFATTRPSVAQTVSSLRAQGAREVVVAPWMLAPGLLLDRVAQGAPDAVHAATIGSHPLLVQVALNRYDAAAHTFDDDSTIGLIA